MSEELTNCENCGQEIPTSEVQKCERCGMDGLGNCCVSDLDHDCDKEPTDV